MKNFFSSTLTLVIITLFFSSCSTFKTNKNSIDSNLNLLNNYETFDVYNNNIYALYDNIIDKINIRLAR